MWKWLFMLLAYNYLHEGWTTKTYICSSTLTGEWSEMRMVIGVIRGDKKEKNGNNNIRV